MLFLRKKREKGRICYILPTNNTLPRGKRTDMRYPTNEQYTPKGEKEGIGGGTMSPRIEQGPEGA